jgi:hypothetical protein
MNVRVAETMYSAWLNVSDAALIDARASYGEAGAGAGVNAWVIEERRRRRTQYPHWSSQGWEHHQQRETTQIRGTHRPHDSTR